MTVAAPALARCTERGCAWRWRSGTDRPCAQHQHHDDDDLAARAAEYGVMMAAPGVTADTVAATRHVCP
jgi:hypothetical protein